ncbi:Ribosomal RNA small subunit methyltransferase F [Geobacillus sp. BCO2]|nr:Ribosomal RNA small subunit methyltransferase F [Geobacillus sp. BCO2]
MFRKDEDAVSFWSPAYVEECAARQRRILESAYAMLKEGGILVYSTCTFSPEENEQTIEWLLEAHDDLRLLPIAKAGGLSQGVQNGRKPIDPISSTPPAFGRTV